MHAVLYDQGLSATVIPLICVLLVAMILYCVFRSMYCFVYRRRTLKATQPPCFTGNIGRTKSLTPTRALDAKSVCTRINDRYDDDRSGLYARGCTCLTTVIKIFTSEFDCCLGFHFDLNECTGPIFDYVSTLVTLQCCMRNEVNQNVLHSTGMRVN